MTALVPLPAVDPHARLLTAYLDGLRSPLKVNGSQWTLRKRAS